MRILIHDYSGHPFQIQLSRALSGRGHTVTHVYNASDPSSPKGALARHPGDPPGLSIDPIRLPKSVVKRALFSRWLFERKYGRCLAKRIRDAAPDVVLMANTPLEAAACAQRACVGRGAPLVWWLQDLIGEAMRRILAQRIGYFGELVGLRYLKLESRLLRSAAHVIGISEDFRDAVRGIGVPPSRYTTIPNWAPLDEIVPGRKANPWSQAHAVDKRFVFLYSGTLGFKHNPRLLLQLARGFSEEADVFVLVNSQGEAAAWLSAAAEKEGLSRLRVNPYQPYGVISDVLAAADVLIAILEPDAGVYSVPSKVLSCHCAGRPLLLAVPHENLAARIVLHEGTGLVVNPRDEAGFLGAARALYENGNLRRQMGDRARAYAEATFSIDRIADRFEAVLGAAVSEARNEAAAP